MTDNNVTGGVCPPLSSRMNVNVLTGAPDKVWVLHDQKLQHILRWAEFDADTRELSLVSHDGIPQPVGLELSDTMTKRIVSAQQIYVVLMQNKKAQDGYLLPLVINGTAQRKGL